MENKDFKAVKVKIKAGQKSTETVSRAMMFSGVNIFGELSRQYIAKKNQSEEQELQEISNQFLNESKGQSDGGIGLQNEELMIFKKVTKKDPITRCKALKQLEQYFEKDSDIDPLKLQNIVTFFLYQYHRILVYEPDTQVREAAQRTFSKFTSLGGTILGRHINQIFAAWFCSFFDSSAEVSRLGRQSFERAFQGSKRDLMFKMSYRFFLDFADEHLKQNEQQLTEDQLDLTKRQKEEIYDRVISQILMALSECFDYAQSFVKNHKDQETADQIHAKIVSYLGLKIKENVKQIKEQGDKKDKKGKEKTESAALWKLLQKSSRPRVRSACLQFVCKFVQYVPQEMSKHHIDHIIPHVFEMVQEDNSAVQGCLWRDAYFTMAQKYPQIWQHATLKKQFIPGILACIKNSAFGAATPLYQNLVKFVSVFPSFRLVDYSEHEGKSNKLSHKDRCNFYSQFFQSLYAGRKNDEAINYHQSLTGAYFETLTFLIEKRFIPFAQSKQFDFENDELKLAWKQIKEAIEMPGIDFIKKYEKKSSDALNTKNVRQSIPMRYNYFATKIVDKNLEESVKSKILQIIKDMIEDNIKERNSLRLLKSFIQFETKNQQVQSSIIDSLLIEQFQNLNSELKEVSAKTVEDLAYRSKNLQRMIRQLQVNHIENNVFKTVTISQLLESIKLLDQTESRAQNLMSKQALQHLQTIKSQYLLLSIISMQRKSEEFDEHEQASQFFKYVLEESKMIEQDTKNFILMPIRSIKAQSYKVNVERRMYYFKVLGQNSNAILQYIIKSIVEKPNDIEKNYETLKGFISFADEVEGRISKEDANQLLKRIKEAIETCANNIKAFYLLSLDHLFNRSKNQKTVFDIETIQSFQQCLIETIISMRSDKKNKKQRQKLWTLLETIFQSNEDNSVLFNTCVSQIKNELTDLIKQMVKDSKQKQNHQSVTIKQVQSIDDMVSLLKQFSEMMDAEKRQSTIQQIALIPENFVDCDVNCLPLKLFRDLFLQGGLSFDVQTLFQGDESINNAWLATLFLRIKDISSLHNFPDLKKQLMVFVSTEVIPSLLLSIKEGNTNLLFKIVELVKDKIESGDPTAIYTLEDILNKIVDPGEDFGNEEPLMKVDDFKKIFSILCKSKAAAILDKNIEDVSIEDLNLICTVYKVMAYYILDEPECVGLMKQVKKNLHIDILTKDDVNLKETVYSLSVYLSLFRHFKTDYDSEMQEFVTQWIIGNFKELFYESQNDSDKSFQLSVLLKFLSAMTEIMGMNKFNQVISFIPEDTLMLTKQKKIKQWLEDQKKLQESQAQKAEEEKQNNAEGQEGQGQVESEQNQEIDLRAKKVEYMQQYQSTLESMILMNVQLSQTIELSPGTYINLLTLIRRVVSNPKIISERNFLIGEIIEISKEKVSLFDQKLKNLADVQQIDQGSTLSSSILHQEDQMLQSLSETLLTCTPYISAEIPENSLYTLLSSAFLPLQKAAFFMLSHLYENHVPKILKEAQQRDDDAVRQELQLIVAAGAGSAQVNEQDDQIDSSENIDSKPTGEEDAKEKEEFKNIPEVMINVIENPPSIEQDDDTAEREKINDNDLEGLIFGSDKEGCLKRNVFGYLLTWSSLLKKIDCGRIKAQLQERDDYSAIIGVLTEYLEQNRYIYQMLLVIIIAYLPKTKRVLITLDQYYQFDPAMIDIEDPEHAKMMSLHTLSAFMKSFPSLARKYYQDCDKKLLDIVQPYIKQIVSPTILDNEIQKIEISQISLNESGQGEGLSFSLFKSTKEITAQYTKGEVSMQLKIQLPMDYPLKGVSVDVGQQMKISARQKNKWQLAIRNQLQIRNGDIISAVLLWKNNIDKEIDGVEECFICYCVLHPTDKSLPRMPCKHCKNKFHVACIRKWFKTSNKSNCPLCQQYFF